MEASDLLGMQDTASIAVWLIFLLVGIAGTLIFSIARRMDSAETYALRTVKQFDVPARQRVYWLATLLAVLTIFPATSWIGHRTDEVRAADKKATITSMDRLLASAKCAPPQAPLEKLVGPMASRADGKPATLACIYVTASLGQVPKLRVVHAELDE